jgi:hypothetical protein
VPPGIDIIEFVQFDGTPPADLQEVPAESREPTLTGSRDCYLATHLDSLEDRTIEGIRLHFKHLIVALGGRFPVRELKLADLQGNFDRRAKAKGMSGRRLTPPVRQQLFTPKTQRFIVRNAPEWGFLPIPATTPRTRASAWSSAKDEKGKTNLGFLHLSRALQTEPDPQVDAEPRFALRSGAIGWKPLLRPMRSLALPEMYRDGSMSFTERCGYYDLSCSASGF